MCFRHIPCQSIVVPHLSFCHPSLHHDHTPVFFCLYPLHWKQLNKVSLLSYPHHPHQISTPGMCVCACFGTRLCVRPCTSVVMLSISHSVNLCHLLDFCQLSHVGSSLWVNVSECVLVCVRYQLINTPFSGYMITDCTPNIPTFSQPQSYFQYDHEWNVVCFVRFRRHCYVKGNLGSSTTYVKK